MIYNLERVWHCLGRHLTEVMAYFLKSNAHNSAPSRDSTKYVFFFGTHSCAKEVIYLSIYIFYPSYYSLFFLNSDGEVPTSNKLEGGGSLMALPKKIAAFPIWYDFSHDFVQNLSFGELMSNEYLLLLKFWILGDISLLHWRFT